MTTTIGLLETAFIVICLCAGPAILLRRGV